MGPVVVRFSFRWKLDVVWDNFHKESVSTLLKRLIMDQIEEDYRKLVDEVEGGEAVMSG